MQWVKGTIIFLLGLVVGSFLGAVSYRVPRGISVVHPPSSCPRCGQRLGLFDLIPLVSYATARGRCRHCGERVPRRYSMIEGLSGVGFVGVYLFALEREAGSGGGWEWTFIIGATLYSLLLVMAVIDLEHMVLPDKINGAGAAAGLGFALAGAALVWARAGFSLAEAGLSFGAVLRVARLGAVTPLQAVYGGLLGYGVVFVIALLSRGGMGMGDAKFLAMIGTFVGPMGVLYTLFGASFLGTVVGGLLIGLGKHERRTPIAFGPFLASAGMGVWVYLMW